MITQVSFEETIEERRTTKRILERFEKLLFWVKMFNVFFMVCDKEIKKFELFLVERNGH